VKIRRFVAKDMRSALAQIKDELGADAVIMSNKKIPEGVELMAAIDYSQPLPDVASNNDKTQAAMREVSNDVVNIGTSSETQVKEENTSALPEPHSSVNTNAPADSLSALLNRQVQHSQVQQNG
jgi:flagellar biosynthesis protein FlhF